MGPGGEKDLIFKWWAWWLYLKLLHSLNLLGWNVSELQLKCVELIWSFVTVVHKMELFLFIHYIYCVLWIRLTLLTLSSCKPHANLVGAKLVWRGGHMT